MSRKVINNVIGGGSASITQVSHAELVALKANAQLKAGKLYRITDYVATTTTFLTQSANHAFDIIVLALDNSTLSEEAAAVQHEGDTYFTNSNLNAWQIWYSLENDTTRFVWADEVNGKGVIYRMIDEFNNDVPYDFKGIQYQMRPGFEYNQWGRNYTFIRNESLDTIIDGVQYYGFSTDTNVIGWDNADCLLTDAIPTTNSVIYKLDGSVISYGGTILSVSTESYDYYTFGVDNDNSLDGKDYSNILPAYHKDNKQNLNFITFGENCHSNTFGNNCHSNTFGDSCFSNKFRDVCYYNTFINGCNFNTFGNNCHSNTFGNNCINNTFGNNCHSNTFENNCHSNMFGDDCYYNTFGDSYINNTHGEKCRHNTFGENYSFNTFGKDCCYVRLSSSDCQYCNLASGLQGEEGNLLEITLTPNLEYETYVAKDSSGNLKQGCLADLLS